MESAFLKIINAKVLTPSGLLPNGQIIISDGKIVEITGQNREIPHAEIIDAKGYYGSRLYRHACTRRQRT